LVFLTLDMLWLGIFAKGFYQHHLGHLLRPDVIWVAALLFYSIFIVGILVFSVQPGLETQSANAFDSTGIPPGTRYVRYIRPDMLSTT
jgi:uncharacterized membrane protein